MRKQTMRMLSVLLCALIAVSSFSVLTAFAAETQTNRKADTVVNSKQTTCDIKTDKVKKVDDSTSSVDKSKRLSTGKLQINSVDNIPKIKTVNQYYSILSKEQGETPSVCKAKILGDDGELPSKVDNSESKYMPPVGNQGGLGACVAWANIYYQMSFAVNKQLDRKATYENSCSPIWVYNFLNRGIDSGSDIIKTVSIASSIGVPSLRTSPNITNGKCWTNSTAAYEEAAKQKIDKIEKLSCGSGDTPITGPKDHDLNLIKSALNNGELLTFAFSEGSEKVSHIQKDKRVPENDKYENKVIIPYMNKSGGSHEITIVGYNDDIWYDINENGKVEDGEKGAFKIVDSHGDDTSDLSDGGYEWVSYDAINRISSVNTKKLSAIRVNGSIVDEIYRISIEKIKNRPNIYFEYTINSRNRNEIFGNIIATNKENGKIYSKFLEPFSSARKCDESISFSGGNDYAKYNFAYDLSNVVENLSSDNLSDYTWKIEFKDTVADNSIPVLSNMKIVDKDTDRVYNSSVKNTIDVTNNPEIINIDTSSSLHESPKNDINIYYKGYSTPYIHYQVGNGSWTKAPGYQMTNDTSQSGYTHKYTINLGNESYANVCFNDGHGNWDSCNGQNYKFEAGTYLFKNGTIKKVQSIGNEFAVKNFSVNDVDGTLYTNETLKLTANGMNGTAPYRYRFGYISNGKEILGNYSSSNSSTFNINSICDIVPIVYIQDEQGIVVSKKYSKINIKKAFSINKIDVKPSSNIKVGDTVTLNSDVDRDQDVSYWVWKIYKDGEEYKLSKYSDNYSNCKFTPLFAGNYKAILKVISNSSGFCATREIQFSVMGNTGNCANVYSKDSSITSIYYSFDKQKWLSSSMSQKSIHGKNLYGSSLKLNSHTDMFMYFVDINGNIYNNNGNYYKLHDNSYMIYNDRLIEMYDSEKSLDVTNFKYLQNNNEPIKNNNMKYNPGSEFSVSAEINGGVKPYNLKLIYVTDNGDKNNIIESSRFDSFYSETFTIYETGTITPELIVTDAIGNSVTKKLSKININKLSIDAFETSLNSPQGVNSNIGLNVRTANNVRFDNAYVNIYLNDNLERKIQLDFNGQGTWNPHRPGNYLLECVVENTNCGKDIAKKEFVINESPLAFTSYYCSAIQEMNVNTIFTINADVDGGTSPYKYEFGYIQDGKVYSTTLDYNTYTCKGTKEGIITPFVKVTDAMGNSITHKFDTSNLINGLKVEKLKVTPFSPQHVGTKLNIKADIINGHTMYGRYSLVEYVIKKDGKVVTTLSDPYLKSTDWTPTEAGNYTITCNVNDISGQSATKTVNFVVKEKNTTENVVTIYYSGYSTPYIHYQVGGGFWTKTPGYKMTPTSEIVGYTHKYIIDLGDKEDANVCFNDGNGNWDSRNGRNYHFEKGTYTFKDGIITPITVNKELSIKSFNLYPSTENINVGQSFSMNVSLSNATTQAVNKFTYVDSNNIEKIIQDYSNATSCTFAFNKSGSYTIKVYSKSSIDSTDYVVDEQDISVIDKQPLKISSFSTNANNGKLPFYDNIKLFANAFGGTAPYQYRFSYTQYNSETIIQDFSSKNTCEKQFAQIGTYTFTVMIKDAEGTIVSQSLNIYVFQSRITGIKVSESSAKIGDVITLSPDGDMASTLNSSNYEFSVEKDGHREKLITNKDLTSNWIPTEPGLYKISVKALYNGTVLANYSINNYEVTGSEENVITIYYKGYSTPYIHYQVGNGNWTAVPGVAMTATNEKSGYTHKYTINLGTSTYANVCFNNGNGSWDSRNGQNYHFEKGTYTFSNGNMTKIAD